MPLSYLLPTYLFTQLCLTGMMINVLLTLTLVRDWWGRCEKNYLPKEEGWRKKRAQRARRTRGSNPGPAAC